LFAVTTTKDKKYDGNKLILIAHFHFKQKEEKNGRQQQACCHCLVYSNQIK